jgi:hypothetical protein
MRLMTTSETYIWHIWPARHWPASAAEETTFLEALQRVANLRSNEVRPFERGDLTTVCNALRNGMSLAELYAVAPGIAPDRLLSAYRHIEQRRAASTAAFNALCAELSERTVNEHAPAAALLLPVPTYRLVAAHLSKRPTFAQEELQAVREMVDATTAYTTSNEQRLASGKVVGDDAVRLGRVLYDPFAGGLWSHAYYVTQRVGTLVPDRTRDLLGERSN